MDLAPSCRSKYSNQCKMGTTRINTQNKLSNSRHTNSKNKRVPGRAPKETVSHRKSSRKKFSKLTKK